MNSKIQNLLDEAERQKQSPSTEQSSVTYAERSFDDARSAEDLFAELKEKLYRVKRWNSNSLFSSFALFDEAGNDGDDRRATVGDFICVILHGSGKNDWVKIISIDETPGEIVLTVQPSFNPTEKEPDKSVVSHFFTDEATNNFCLQRENEMLKFYVVGLNEKSNTGDTKNLLETVRNVATTNVGSFLGVQTAQWQTFCDNFLETNLKNTQ